MAAQKDLESAMDKYLVKDAPFQIPDSGRKAIADIAPILAIIGAVLSLIAAYSLWHTAHAVNELADIANSYARAFGVEDRVNHLGVTYYASLVAIVLQGLLLAYAYPGLKAKSKSRGWDILLLGVVVSLVYDVLVAFTNYGGVTNVIGGLIGTVISLYILAQIKDQYSGKKAAVTAAKAVKK